MHKVHIFGCISVPNGVELISTELFLITDGFWDVHWCVDYGHGQGMNCMFLQMGFI